MPGSSAKPRLLAHINFGIYCYSSRCECSAAARSLAPLPDDFAAGGEAGCLAASDCGLRLYEGAVATGNGVCGPLEAGHTPIMNERRNAQFRFLFERELDFLEAISGFTCSISFRLGRAVTWPRRSSKAGIARSPRCLRISLAARLAPEAFQCVSSRWKQYSPRG